MSKSASLSSALPFFSEHLVPVQLGAVDVANLLRAGAMGPDVFVVTPDYFATAQTALLLGRTFTTNDDRGAARVTIVNDVLARAAVGKTVES